MFNSQLVRRRTNGWLIDPKTRESLLARFPPKYSSEVVHHVTLTSGLDRNTDLPDHTRGVLIGRADDNEGVEAFVIEIAGTTERPGGGTYHVTWSLDRTRHREARESNDVIARFGWAPLEQPIEIELMPAVWERDVPVAQSP